MLFGITGLGSAAVAVALPTLADDLEVSTGRAALVVSCYSLALAVGSAVCGRLGDLLGIRLPLLVGLAIMVTAASAGALVDSLPALVVTRTLQGLGASAAPALTLAAVQALFAGDARARALATYAGIGGTVNALGPVIGSALVDPFGWRPVVAIPLVTLAFVPVVWRHLPTDRQPGATLDPAGVLLVGAAAIGAVMSLQAATLGPAVAVGGGVLLLVAAPAAVLRARRVPFGVVPQALLRSSAARSYRAGFELEGRLDLTGKLALVSNAALSRNRIREAGTSIQPVLTPWVIINQEVQYHLQKTFVSVTARYQGRSFIDYANTVTLPDFYTLAAQVSQEFGKLRLTLRGNNLTNRRYYQNGVIGLDGRPYYFLQAPVNYFVSAAYSF